MENRRLFGIQHAVKGISKGYRGSNFRVMLSTSIIVVAMCSLLQTTIAEWTMITICIMATLAAELMNTAIEKLCDYITTEYHTKIGEIKDLAAGAVLILSIGSGIIGLMILAPKVYRLVI